MSNGLISFFFALGVAAWVYAQVSHSSGNASPKTSFGIAGAAGLFSFLFLYTLLQSVLRLE